jgi:serine/threonine-protein kinase
MGVVYRARQVRLNRTVALKMISAGDHATPEALARFLAEAEAVARLRHPNVVQVYDRGECDGLPFYSMEFFAGGSLARRCDGTPWPALDAARAVEQVARGVAEVHRHGIIHRDLKPANILLGDNGTPKVTDFGLAKSLDSESGLTRTDLIMGTPSYMAPEQARGLAKAAGPAADIYALGVILYELLTGRPPFRASTALETLEQVRSAEPVPPSRLVPGVPRDAETIALKCLQKDPARRYATALDLAEDLRRFAAGETIVARPVGPAVRAGRWCRRHPELTALGALLALAIAAGVAGVIVEWRRAEHNLAEARRHFAEAQSNFTLARRAVDELLTKISENRLVAEPGLQGLRRELLGAAAGYFREFAGRRQDDPALRAERVLAHNRLGKIELEIATTAEAEAEFRRALDAAGDDAGDDAVERARSEAYFLLATAQLNSLRPREGLQSTETAMRIIAGLLARHPGDVKLRKVEAQCFDERANALEKLGQFDEQQRDLKDALSRWDGLIREHPEDTESRRERTAVIRSMATALTRTSGHGEEGLAAYRTFLDQQRELAGSPSSDMRDREALATGLTYYGEYLGFNLGRWGEARTAFNEALGQLERLVAGNPLVVTFRRLLAGVRYELGYLELRQANYREAAAHYREAVSQIERLHRDSPGSRRATEVSLPEVLIDLGELRRLSGDLDGAKDALEGRCLPLLREWAKAEPAVVRHRLLMGMAGRYLARVRLEAGDAPGAIEVARSGETLLEPDAASRSGSYADQEELARLRLVLADALRAAGRSEEALAASDRCIRGLEDLVKSNPEKPDMRDALGEALIRRAAIKRAGGRPDAIGDDIRRGRALLEALPRDDPTRLVRLAVARLADGRPEAEALDALRGAVDAGLACLAALQGDPDLASLRDHEAFRRLVQKVEARSKDVRR